MMGRKMKDLKQIKFHARPEFADALKELAKQTGDNQSEVIVKAIQHYASMLGTEMPTAVAPHGVRSDALPKGWKSRLYPDRYVLIAYWDGSSIKLEQHHLSEREATDSAWVIETAGNKFVVYPSGFKWDDLHKHDVILMLMEWDA